MIKRTLLSIITITSIFSSKLTASLFNGTTTNPQNIYIDNNITKTKNSIVAPNEAIILFKDGTSFDYMVKIFNRVLPIKYYTEYKTINALHIIVPDKSFEDIKKILLNTPFLKDSIASIERNSAVTVYQKSNDNLYLKQWAIENRGETINGTKGVKDADMDISEAWDIEKGEHSVVVAVIDTGVDYTHNDLSDNMWSGNKKHGYDFAGDNSGNNDDDPMPDTPYNEKGHYHGTHVAGIIGAVGDNTIGISGVAQNVQIMALKVFRPNGEGYSSDILEALDYIIKKKKSGVNIVAVNASYGGSNGSSGDSMSKAISKLGDLGIIFCAAAGNESINIDLTPRYPATYSAKNIISVAATNQDDNLTTFSNYGKDSVDVAAPGINILSTYPDNQYAYMQGTSMATPNVTGVVALIKSLDPDATVDDIINTILKNVDKKSLLKDKVATSGRVNAYKALKSIADNKLSSTSTSNKNQVLKVGLKANDDNITLYEDHSISIDVLSNDSIDNNTTIKNITKPKNGVVVLKNNKLFFTPNRDYYGYDSFSYTIFNSSDKSSAKVYITIKPINDAPIAKDDSVELNEDSSLLIDVLKNDKDTDNTKLTIEFDTKPLHGRVSLKNSQIEYIPNNNFNGEDSFFYKAKDSGGLTSKAKVDIYVKPINDRPIAIDDNISTKFNQKILIDILKNDKDVDGDNLIIKSTTKPTHGEVKIENNTIIYKPELGFSGIDKFRYTISDSKLESSAKVIVNVEGSNKETPIKIDIIEQIIKFFSSRSALNKIGYNKYILDNGNGYIEIDDIKKEVKLVHKKTPFPKEPFGKLESFKYDGNKIEFTYSIKNSIKF